RRHTSCYRDWSSDVCSSDLLVAFLRDPSDRRKLEPLTKQHWAPEVLALGTRVAYLWCPEGILASRLAEAANRVLGDAVTARNWEIGRASCRESGEVAGVARM